MPQAGWQLLEECEHVPTLQLATDDDDAMPAFQSANSRKHRTRSTARILGRVLSHGRLILRTRMFAATDACKRNAMRIASRLNS